VTVIIAGSTGSSPGWT